MNNIIQTNIGKSEEIITYNNIDINISLSFNNLAYTLSYENSNYPNSKKYLTNNSLLLNVEDDNTIYNVFKKSNKPYSYQLNNLIFIDNEKNMHLLNYNLISTQKSLFSIDNNDIINVNILNKSNNSYYPFQSIFAYNSSNYSYIYSNEQNLDIMSLNKQGLYYIDNNNVILNDNRISIDINKFNYNYNLIKNIHNNTSKILNNYQDNIDIFYQTNKYKNINYSSNIKYNKNVQKYLDNNVLFITFDKSLDLNMNYNYESDFNYNENNIILKDIDYFIIDIPIEYEYETVINKEYQYNKHICPINIDNINYSITKESNAAINYEEYISLNSLKSFIHHNQCLSIYTNYKSEESPVIMKEKCRVSLYFSVDKNIYQLIHDGYKSNNTIKFNLNLSCNKNKDVKYKLNCYVDVISNQFKKLYHNYNYGFNFNGHGNAIGIMLLKKNLSKDQNVNNIIIGNNSINLSYKFEVEPINKDVYLNYDQDAISNILVQIDNINYTNILSSGNINFNNIEIYSEDTVQIKNPSDIIGQLSYPERLKTKDLTQLYLNSENLSINKYKATQTENTSFLLNNIFIDNRYGLIKLNKYNRLNNIVNNHYIMNFSNHKKIFSNIYNYRKSGLSFGDFYTPCLQDYMMIYLFSIEKYFDFKSYQDYFSHFCKKNKVDPSEEKIFKYRLLTNQFYRNTANSSNNSIYQYCVQLSNDDDTVFNNYQINLYNQRINTDSTHYDINYVWPLFRIPDYSVINSNDYIIMFSEKDNCEHIDYYINNEKNIYINFRSYNDDNPFEFFIFDEKLQLNKQIRLISTELIDKENDIYQIHLYTDVLEKLKIFYVVFIDSEPDMNNIEIKSKKYRILCKVFLKNEGI